MVTYALESFFRTPEAARECQAVLKDETKKVLVFVGSGGNGKSQLCRQISAAHPEKFSVYHEESAPDIPERIQADIAAGRRVLVCANTVPSLKGIEGDVTFMDRTFGALVPTPLSFAQ